MKKNVTYIVSDISKSLAFEWIADGLDKNFSLNFILINSGENSPLFNFLRTRGIPVVNYSCNGKLQLPRLVWKIYRSLKSRKPDVVHCHLFLANMAGLTAAKLAGVPKRILTRHHSSYHHQYHPASVKWDKYCNRIATHIVSISKVVTHILIEKEAVPHEKVREIPHGIKTELFSEKHNDSIEHLRQQYNPGMKEPVVGVISRFIQWKGVQFIVPAFQDLLHKYPNALLLLFNAEGPHEKSVLEKLKPLPRESWKAVPFENDIASAYHLFHVFVHTPIDAESEAFGQTYIEAMAAGIPSVFTLSGIACEVVRHEENALVVPYADSKAIADALNRLLNEPLLREKIVAGGQRTAASFTFEKMIRNLEQLYLE